MPFTTANDTAYVLSSMGSGWELWDSNADRTDSGWDTLNVVAAKDYGTTTVNAAQVAAAWPIGAVLLPGQKFWINHVRPRRQAGNIWTVDASGKGLLATRPVHVSGRTGVEQQNSESAIVPGYFGAQRAQFLSITPTIDIGYISFSPPPTARVGLAGLPQYAVPVRASLVTGITKPLVHFPSGWVFMDLTWEKLVGVNVWLIKETWNYIFKESI